MSTVLERIYTATQNDLPAAKTVGYKGIILGEGLDIVQAYRNAIYGTNFMQ